MDIIVAEAEEKVRRIASKTKQKYNQVFAQEFLKAGLNRESISTMKSPTD